MKQLSLAACAAGAFLLLAIISQTGAPTASAMQAGVINGPDLIYPSVKVVRLGETVVRFDTSNGELSRFSGKMSGSSAAGRWLRLARPLTANTSGLLDVQEIGGGTFLIDLDTGKTWLLRRSGATLGTWVAVQKS